MKVTIKDIAKKLNMNYSTVSYALSGKGTLSKETREQILKTAAEMGYVANRSAQLTRTGSSKQIGIIVPNLLNEYGELCEYLFRILSERGYIPLITISEFSRTTEIKAVQFLLGAPVDGVIIVPVLPQSEEEFSGLALLKQHQVPTVIRMYEKGENAVAQDYYRIGAEIARMAAEKGKKYIAHTIMHAPPYQKNVTELMRGLQENALSGQKVRLLYPEETGEKIPEGIENPHYFRQMQTLLKPGSFPPSVNIMDHFESEGEFPDLIVAEERMIIGIYNECAKRKISVPDQISLIATQKTLQSRMLIHELSAVMVPMRVFAEKISEMLLNKLEGKNSENTCLIPPEICPGETFK